MREWETWSEIVTSKEQLPAMFRDCLSDEKPLPYCVYVPEYLLGGQNGGPKLVCLNEDCLTIFEQTAPGQSSRARYRFGSIERIVHGKILLFSWIEIHGLFEGKKKKAKITYNSVSEDALRPIFMEPRYYAAGLRMPEKDGLPSDADFGFLRANNLKFYRCAPKAVLVGDTVRRVLFQPQLQARILGLIPYMVLPNQIVILTDREIIIIRDGGWSKSEGRVQDSYGAVRSFIPLAMVRDVAITDARQADLKQLSIKLPHEEVCLRFDARLEKQLSAFRLSVLSANAELGTRSEPRTLRGGHLRLVQSNHDKAGQSGETRRDFNDVF
ncbi:hypothetical protein ATER59S_00408 [Aquamicrobium terrae]